MARTLRQFHSGPCETVEGIPPDFNYRVDATRICVPLHVVAIVYLRTYCRTLFFGVAYTTNNYMAVVDVAKLVKAQQTAYFEVCTYAFEEEGSAAVSFFEWLTAAESN